MEGGAGRDLFVYSSGRDEIDDFSTRDDTISLDASLGVTSFSQLMTKARQVDEGEDVLFNFGSGNTLLLEDVKLSSLKASHFGFSSGASADASAASGQFKGTSKADTFSGGAGNDKIWGYSGNDVLKGGSGHDDIYGGNGNDKLYGGNGNDEIEGGSGNDLLYGGNGHDELDGDKGNDKLYGGNGNDDLEGGAGDDWLDGGNGRNELKGGSGADTFVFKTGITEIEDYRAGTDTVIVAKSLGVSNFDDLVQLATAVDGGDDLRFDFGGARLTFEDTKLGELKAGDFLFT
ncbi:hemolysin type calcium-binding protein [Rhizobium subbaraonis]|uniref:Hemolysin type calcium-binding protein n=2 Tax=Rhizobium subbaraonis TaxID=908946 RepID=A0A285UAR2_9HYPH|nr:hemolysin type calcium-binding protein [Rhizobium subbaraonis]